jgi:hypothetical protein
MAANFSPGIFPTGLPAKSPKKTFARSLLDSNLFYLISACCMLAGCVALTNSLSWVSIPTSKLLILIFTLNLYEAALIGLAAYLILVRGLRRDGMILIILEVFFLIDVTFLVSEIATQKSWIGPTIAIITYLAAVVKLAAILGILGVRRLSAEFVFILAQIATILALPIIFSRHSDGSVSPLSFYIAWWVVGLMPAGYELLTKCFGSPEPSSPLSRIMTTYVLLPWLSLVGHLGILHYVYDVPFFGAMAAPILLALAMALNRAPATRLFSRRDILVVRTLLPLAAIFVSGNCPNALTLMLDHSGHLVLTTLHLALIGTYLEYVYFFIRSYWISAMLVGIVSVLAYLYGPTADQIERWADGAWNWTSTHVMNFLPTTQIGWGATGVVAAFVFLALGAAVSLRRVPIPSESTPPEP